MSINLNAPLDRRTANADEKALLADLQANILKGHGRLHTAQVFLHFDRARRPECLSWVHQIGAQLVSAATQFQQTDAYKATGTPGDPIVCFFLSRMGYTALGVAPAKIPTDASFTAGMKAAKAKLNDTDKTEWDETYQGEVHAMLLVADVKATGVNKKKALLKGLPDGITILGTEIGDQHLNANGDGMEHFGYVDGRSQPLLLVEDIEHERDRDTGIAVWDPKFPIKQALVRDNAGATANSFGSYFVFRKLEQNVQGFKGREDEYADALGLKGADRERAGAMIVGRFEDGTPVVMQKADGMHHPVPNNFDYSDDANALKCPFHAHIRKSNPRGESTQLGATLEEERAHIMARRGITYGKRAVKRKGKGVVFTGEPKGGVGLLFMAYQNDIAKQFEFTQATWVNNKGFVHPGTGVDPVIGQGSAGGQHAFPNWGNAPATAEVSFTFKDFVTLKGGEYFFAPSISGLKNL
jgi:Dyp-type peroxidase family